MRIRSVATLVVVFCSILVFAQSNSVPPATTVVVPTLIRFSGTVPETSATVGVTFALYKEQTGGSSLWLEMQNVTLDNNGRYIVNLGANHAGGIPAELFAAGEARWLGVQAEGQPEQPRILLVSVPYAMKAADSDTLGGLPASAYVTAEQLNQSAVGSRQLLVAPQGSEAADFAKVMPSPCTAVTSDGTALNGYITKFTTPCNVENSGLYQSTAGFLAVGTTAPVAPLDLELPVQTGTTGSIFGEHLIASVNPAANSAANSYAFFGQASTATGNTFNFTGDLLGSGFIVQHNGTGTVTNAFGGNYTVINHSTGTITNAASFYGLVTNQSTGTITNGYGLEIPPPQNTGGGAFTNFYGVYVANPTGATNSWGLYTLAAKNYVSGDLGIGVTAPTQALEINGNIKIDTTGHGITYPDGTIQTTASIPGSGTITKVTAGTDLTGGGSSGAVALNLDTTKVPTLAATTNTFTGTGGIAATHFSGDGTNVTNVNATELGGVTASGYPQLATFNGFTAAQNITGMGSGYILEAINNYTGTGSSAIYATSAGSNGVGVYGEADNGFSAYGVEGLSTSGAGVYGTSSGPNGYSGSAGVYGYASFHNQSNYGGFGVTGESATGIGVFGVLDPGSNEGGTVGVFDGGYGIWADAGTGNAALVATADNLPAAAFYNNASAGHYTLSLENDYFNTGAAGEAYVFATHNKAGNANASDQCLIDTDANLTCTGTITAMAPTRDLRRLEMYSVHSTENWYEDAGSGQLRNGVASVRLDADFADITNTGMEYHVFLTPEGNCKGLYVANKAAGGFEVRELGTGHSNIAFDYRIMAKRKGKESLRMTDVTERMKVLEASRPARRKEGTAPPHRTQPIPPVERPVQKASLVETK